jgi:hypothetical protein
MKTVWIYADKTVGDANLKVFESPGVFERWKETNDPDAVAIEYVVIEAGNVNRFRLRPQRTATTQDSSTVRAK